MDSGDPTSPGHTVLAVPVPALDDVIRERTAHYDESFVSADPRFTHAHVTLLAPWHPDPGPGELAAVAEIAAGARAFTFRLGKVGEFPDGVIHLRPEPDGPFRELTARLAAAFPGFPPYGGQYDEVVPHLTVDRRSEPSATEEPDELGKPGEPGELREPGELGKPVTPESVDAWLGDRVPVTAVADRIDLQWWANHDCRLLRSWRLG